MCLKENVFQGNYKLHFYQDILLDRTTKKIEIYFRKIRNIYIWPQILIEESTTNLSEYQSLLINTYRTKG